MRVSRVLSLQIAASLVLLSFIGTINRHYAEDSLDIKANYQKSEHTIAMRDGAKLFTVVYAPKDASKKYPILLIRTPYSAGPYGADAYKDAIGPSPLFMKEGYIFVYQDVRGRFMS